MLFSFARRVRNAKNRNRLSQLNDAAVFQRIEALNLDLDHSKYEVTSKRPPKRFGCVIGASAFDVNNHLLKEVNNHLLKKVIGHRPSLFYH